MTTVIARRGRDGSLKFTAQLRFKNGGRVVYSEARTFLTELQAQSWAGEEREQQLKSSPRSMERAVANRSQADVARLVDRYIEQFEAFARWGRTKRADLDRRGAAYGQSGLENRL